MHDPEGYEKTKVGLDPVAVDAFSTFHSKMKWSPGELFLDFGCGGGSNLFNHVLPLAKKYNSKIHGVDISQVMIEHAKENNCSEEIEYFVGDIMKPEDFGGHNKYDKVFSYHVIHWIKDYGTALKRFNTILKPGGFIGATIVTSGPQFEMIHHLGLSEKWGKYMKGYRDFIPQWIEENKNAKKEIGKGLLKAGFEIVDTHEIVLRHGIDINPLLDLLLSLNPFLNEIPQDMQKELRETGMEVLRSLERMNFPIFKHDGLCFVARKPNI